MTVVAVTVRLVSGTPPTVTLRVAPRFRPESVSVVPPAVEPEVVRLDVAGGAVALPNRSPYASSKGAVVMMTKVLALEGAPRARSLVNFSA